MSHKVDIHAYNKVKHDQHTDVMFAYTIQRSMTTNFIHDSYVIMLIIVHYCMSYDIRK